MATGATTNYFLPYPLSTDPVRVAGDIEQLATKIDTVLKEEIEDTSASMWTGGNFSNGLGVPTYNDSTGKMSMSLAQDIQTTATPTFTGVNLIGGDLYLGSSRSIIFEGSGDDANETTFVVTDPTADRTITFQNATGTVAFTSESTLASLVNIANADGAITLQIGYGATTSGTTKTINIGPSGVSGSITNINIGSSISGAVGTTTINSITTSLLGDITIATGKSFQINGTSVLNSTTLGSSVVSSSLTSVGTITTGVWSATEISANKGGTGQTSYTIGDILYASSSTALSKLAGVATGNALISGGVGVAPSWGKIDLGTHISGTLAVANGGTGATTSTGTGSMVLSTSPTFTGTVSAETITASTLNSTGSDLTFLSSVSGSPSLNASIIVNRGTSPDVSIRWNESGASWQYTNDGTTYFDIGSGSGGSAGLQDVLLLAGM
jgi:hypothetical protein